MLHCPACGHNFRTDAQTSIAGRLSRYVSQKQEATPSRAVRSCRTAGLPSPAGASQMAPNSGSVDAVHHRRRILGSPVEPPSFYKSLRQEEAALDLDRLHVLKIRNREAESGVMTKDKFSKYSPLPDISRPHGRPLLRQKTYDVLDPVYVKGPSSPRQPAKDKPPPPRMVERGRTATVASRTTPKDSHAKDNYNIKDGRAKDSYSTKDGHVKDSNFTKDSHSVKTSHPPRDSIAAKDNSNHPSHRRPTKLPHIAAMTPNIATPTPNTAIPTPNVTAPMPNVAAPSPNIAASTPNLAAVPVKRHPLRRTSQFRPQELSKDILPQSPTAFWFPI